jgi:hypothetical protein
MHLPPALWFFLAWIAFLFAVDLLFYLHVLPGGTISDNIWWDSERAPLSWHLFYFGLTLFGYYHFFGLPRVLG